jgi:YfiH family protein
VHSRTLIDGRVSLAYPALDRPWLVHGTVVFKDPGFEGPDSVWRQRMRDWVRQNIRPAPEEMVIPVQVHGGTVLTVGARRGGGRDGTVSSPVCDGLVTQRRGVMIGVNTADCIPLLAVGGSARFAGVAHCGWRGIAAGVVESFLLELDRVAGKGGRRGVRFVVGASVGACCYEVRDDLLRAFAGPEASECARSEGGRTFFDLKGLVRLRLMHGGIDREAVFTDNTCTSCESDLLCSYRAAGRACGRMYSYVMITE